MYTNMPLLTLQCDSGLQCLFLASLENRFIVLLTDICKLLILQLFGLVPNYFFAGLATQRLEGRVTPELDAVGVAIKYRLWDTVENGGQSLLRPSACFQLLAEALLHIVVIGNRGGVLTRGFEVSEQLSWPTTGRTAFNVVRSPGHEEIKHNERVRSRFDNSEDWRRLQMV
jgi:hypothetical protein